MNRSGLALCNINSIDMNNESIKILVIYALTKRPYRKRNWSHIWSIKSVLRIWRSRYFGVEGKATLFKDFSNLKNDTTWFNKMFTKCICRTLNLIQIKVMWLGKQTKIKHSLLKKKLQKLFAWMLLYFDSFFVSDMSRGFWAGWYIRWIHERLAKIGAKWVIFPSLCLQML